MDRTKSLDNIYIDIVRALLQDIHKCHGEVYSTRDRRLDEQKLISRYSREGISLLTKTLPRLGRALDRALSGEVSLDCTGFRKIPSTQLPKFLGGLFRSVFSHDGRVLPDPSVKSIQHLRQVLFLLGKLELPYDKVTEQKVIDGFKATEDQLLETSATLAKASREFNSNVPLGRQFVDWLHNGHIITKARCRLARLFASFDPLDIQPAHGPGAVSTRERLSDKWTFRNVSGRIADSYPIDAFFYASVRGFSDNLHEFNTQGDIEDFARVVLVPKDSRGPRLISCEPLAFQYVQQGLSRAIVKHVERHPLTKWGVRFTNQQPNQLGALLGSKYGGYATLDLKDASDRVTLGLVRLLFPEPLLGHLENCRSMATELPGGEYMMLTKFAPMGSALCFPILALTVWALLTAAAPDADSREGVYVFGDDVIVPTAQAENAIEVLESFGLKVNRDKSFLTGFFRESCGVDAYKGIDVTPIRLRKVWASHRCPHAYSSWTAYANSLWDKQYYGTYWVIADRLFELYREIPERTCVSDVDPRRKYNTKKFVSYVPSLACVPQQHRPQTSRVNHHFQRVEYRVWSIRSKIVTQEIDGWKMLLRYFCEGPQQLSPDDLDRQRRSVESPRSSEREFRVREYTERDSIVLNHRWQ